jgi:hypothetical protein
LADVTPVIVFGKGCWFALGEMGKSKLQHGVGGPVHYARYLSGECYYKVILIQVDCFSPIQLSENGTRND